MPKKNLCEQKAKVQTKNCQSTWKCSIVPSSPVFLFSSFTIMDYPCLTRPCLCYDLGSQKFLASSQKSVSEVCAPVSCLSPNVTHVTYHSDQPVTMIIMFTFDIYTSGLESEFVCFYFVTLLEITTYYSQSYYD